ncbi:hypothetical protein [Sporomusa termitida]|nr:hypothetical protein [Sporomusa termitida]
MLLDYFPIARNPPACQCISGTGRSLLNLVCEPAIHWQPAMHSARAR